MSRFLSLAIFLIGGAALSPAPVHALFVTRSAASPQQAAQGEIVGHVVDSATGASITNAHVRLLELERADLSHQDGSFHFSSLTPRSYTILAQRIGYAPARVTVTVERGSTANVMIEMTATALELEGVVVTGTGRARGASEAFRPTTVVGDAELRRRLESSVSATIAHLPGISQSYNGPAASQPVIRGMGGDRVLVLEDGQRTGDLSTTSADHALTIDPLTAQRIEVVRGPAGLMYGSNALGGVINVVREEVPRTLPERATGAVALQAETVNEGVSGGASVVVPHGGLALRGELSGRNAGDTRTPLGDLPSTEMSSYGGSVAASWIGNWGFIGSSYRDLSSDYGVPGEFGEQVIPGAHPGGVNIETRRRAGRVEAAHLLGFGPISAISFDANLVFFEHLEREGEEHVHDQEHEHEEDEEIGGEFQNLFGSANLVFRHEHTADPVFTEGAVGFYGSGRDLKTGGATGARDASSVSLAAYLYEELTVDRFRLQLGGRYDWVRVTPQDLSPIVVGGREIPVRERTFGAISGSVAGLVELVPQVTAGASVARAFRTPTVEELLSDGPHLADYSFNIGSPDLDPEIGVGADLFLRIDKPTFHAEITFFRNWLTNYIHYAPTGEMDPREGRFPVFEARGADAVFTGAEASAQWEIARRLVLEGGLSGVRAELSESGDPLPAIPPINGFAEARYESERYFLTLGVDGALRQRRVASAVEVGGTVLEVERPTAGYALLDFGGGLRWTVAGRLHTLTLQVDNATDKVWRDHLSRIKEVAPQPGRNIQLLYRVQL